jgi:uncharacterized protein YdaU (DUF1376 family)
MPLWVNRFMGGTLGMTGEQRALYLLLLMTQWASGPLPEDFNEIAELVGYNEKTFKRLWPKVSKKFKATDAGLVNMTLEEIRAESEKRHAMNSERAAAAAAARWGKPKASAKSMLRVVPGGMLGASAEQCSEHSSKDEK